MCLTRILMSVYTLSRVTLPQGRLGRRRPCRHLSPLLPPLPRRHPSGRRQSHMAARKAVVGLLASLLRQRSHRVAAAAAIFCAARRSGGVSAGGGDGVSNSGGDGDGNGRVSAIGQRGLDSDGSLDGGGNGDIGEGGGGATAVVAETLDPTAGRSDLAPIAPDLV